MTLPPETSVYGLADDDSNGEGLQVSGGPQSGGVQFVIDPATARGEYANFFQVRFNPIEMVLDFCRIIPEANAVEVVSRVLVHPRQCAMLAEMLRVNLDAYRKQFDPQSQESRRTESPSGIGFRTSEDLRRMGLDVPVPRRIQLPSDPSKPDPGAAAKSG
ncbi:MAG: hypothetical protein GEEBNDBF_00013 [bacterium]|nr:hypothetical protein [bacterium]